ncbi:MAG: hypothetical protein FP816_18920 [Desulfobacteraceae bacterium]|nr:hypothetical protein [Desulfobacteraceae bacterium]
MAFDKRISKIEAILENYKPAGESIKIIFADDPGFAEKLEKDDTTDLQNGLEPDCITIHFHRPRPQENA